jgi:hypothetical protein
VVVARHAGAGGRALGLLLVHAGPGDASVGADTGAGSFAGDQQRQFERVFGLLRELGDFLSAALLTPQLLIGERCAARSANVSER